MDFLKEALSELDDRDRGQASRRTWVNLTLRMAAGWAALGYLEVAPPDIGWTLLDLVQFGARTFTALFTLVWLMEVLKAAFRRVGRSTRLLRGEAIWLKFHEEERVRGVIQTNFANSQIISVNLTDGGTGTAQLRRDLGRLERVGAVHPLATEGDWQSYVIDRYLWEYIEHTSKPWTKAILRMPSAG